MGQCFARGHRDPTPLAEAACRPVSVAATLTRLSGASFVTFLPVRGSADDWAASPTLPTASLPLPAYILSLVPIPVPIPGPVTVLVLVSVLGPIPAVVPRPTPAYDT